MSGHPHRRDLILWRHAEAAEGVPDFSRPLTERGREQAAAMADWLKPRLPRNCKLLASPAVRARETIAALGLAYTTSRDLGTDATPSGVLAAVDWPALRGPALLVGHQPTLGRVASLLLAGRASDWSIKKGAVWWFKVDRAEGEPQVELLAALSPQLLS